MNLVFTNLKLNFLRMNPFSFFLNGFPTCVIHFLAYENRFPTYAIQFLDYKNEFPTYVNHFPTHEIG